MTRVIRSVERCRHGHKWEKERVSLIEVKERVGSRFVSETLAQSVRSLEFRFLRISTEVSPSKTSTDNRSFVLFQNDMVRWLANR